MNSRSNLHSCINNSVAIRQEIQRFESVHPSIYAIYDLIELVHDPLISQQIRDHVVCIEDSFVNSQEWTLCRSVPDLRVGIVGSLSSGKSALVHRYLTGSYMQEESPEGGRFKKEVVIDGQSHLLLIRDEGGLPEYQFATWVDAVIFVFSLENEASFNAIYSYYTKLSHYRNYNDVPMILVGTQDAISDTNSRVIDDAKARRLASDLKRCPYYETCATYGLNVDRVFQDVCQRIVQQRISSLTCLSTASDSKPTTPCTPNSSPLILSNYNNNNINVNNINHNWHTGNCPPSPNIIASSPSFPIAPSPNSPSHCPQSLSYNKDSLLSSSRNNLSSSSNNLHRHADLSIAIDANFNTKHSDGCLPKDLPTPTSTPNTTRKVRRRSNLFMTSSSKKSDDKIKNGELGSGRSIPLKQGYLYKKSGKTLNKEWKKKYVTLCDNGRLTYHPSLHDYMEDIHGKQISLQYVTVKIPGQKPRGSKTVAATNAINDFLSLSVSGLQCKDKKNCDKVTLTAFEVFKESNSKVTPITEDSMMITSSSSLTFTNGNTTVAAADNKIETPNVKKRHRRLKSTSIKNQECEDCDGYEFHIVSLDNKQWQFEATSHEDRNEWIVAIEQQILSSLQGIEISKGKSRLHSSVEAASILSIRTCVAGNTLCADCGSPNPDWASMNLGVLVCIECSGVHRNLGSHISKIRSLDLDEWPQENLSVMLSVGNTLANCVWEGNIPTEREKPRPKSKREEKEQWIRSKYELKEFLLPLSNDSPICQQLVDAIYKNDMKMLILLLSHATADDVNEYINQREYRTALHVACALGSLPMAQLLIWNSADTKAIDYEGRTCLSYVNNAIRTQYDSSGNITTLKNLLTSCGCPDPANGITIVTSTSVHNNNNTKSISNGNAKTSLPSPSSTTLSRQRSNYLPPLDKLPSSII